LLTDNELIQRFDLLKSLLELEKEEESRSMQTQIHELGATNAERKGLVLNKMIYTNFKIFFGGKYLYSFEKSNQSQIPHSKITSGSWVQVLDSQSVEIMRAIVYSNKKNEINLVSNDFIDDRDLQGLFKIELCVDNVTYKRLEQGLNDLVKLVGNKSKNLLIPMLKFDQKIFNDYKCELLKLIGSSANDLNEAQIDAVKHALSGAPLTLIHGPPGTGKTKTISAIIYNLVQNEKKVLVCAGTNTAVDHIVKNLIKYELNAIRVGHPSRVDNELSFALLEKKLDQTESGKHISKIKKELHDCLRTKKKRIDKGRFLERSEFRSEKELIKSLRKEIKHLSHKCLEELVIDKAVFCSTTTMSRSDDFNKLSFDYIVIDEAAQIIEPMSYLPMLKGTNFIFAGDHNQLPATIKSSKCLEKGLGKSLFESLVESFPQAVHLLNTQYRMHSDILKFSSDYFYGGLLKTADNIKDRQNITIKSSFLSGLKKAIFIDTSGADFEEETLYQSGSYINPKESSVVGKIIEELFDQGTEGVNIGVIAPYRAQANYIKDSLEDKEGVEVNTVDSFQGREKDCILISLTRCNDKKQIGFLKEVRRMNVAMTRAKHQLIIIGDGVTIGEHNFFTQMIQYFQEIGGYHSIWEFPDLM